MTVFIKQFRAEMQVAMREIDKATEEVTRDALSAGYSYMMSVWPIWTGYSAANNWVTLQGPKSDPEPAQRPSHKGAMEDEVAIQFEEGLQVITNFRLMNGEADLFISNPVPYAVQFARGGVIYQTVAELTDDLIRTSWANYAL